MSELISKCHGAKVEFSEWGMTTDGKNIYYSGWICSKCHKPTEVRIKNDEQKKT